MVMAICLTSKIEHSLNQSLKIHVWIQESPNISYLCDKTKADFVDIFFDIDFYPRPVLAFGYCHCLRLSVCVSVCVHQPSACPRDKSLPVSARITKFGP